MHQVSENTHTKKKKTQGSDPKWKTVSSNTFNHLLAHCIVDKLGNDPNCGLFAIFDGHGGKQVSEYCAERFPIELRKELQKSPNDLCKPLADIFSKVSLLVRVNKLD